MKYKQYVSSCFSLNGHDHSWLYTQSYSVLGDYDEDTPPVPFDGLAHLIIYYHFRLCHNTLPLPLPLSCPGKPEKINLNEAGTESKPVTAAARLFTHQMGQSSSTVNLISPEPSDFTDEIKIGPLTDYTDGIPDECLACIFQLLNAADRKRSSLVCKRWLRVDGQSRRRLSLNAQSEITSYVPSIFTRFDSVAKLSLRCDRKSLSLNDDALRMISIQCESLTRLKLRGCREVTELGMADFAKNCKNLTKFSCGSCNFGAKGINMLLKYCIKLEELTIKRLRSVNYGNDLIVPGAAALSLKSICLKELVNGQCFETLVVECKMLKTLKVIRCLGDWDNVLVKMGNGNDSLSDVHLERLQLSDIGLGAISKCVNIDSLHIVKNPECSNLGLVSVAENCKKLKKLHIDGWKINQIGDEGLMAVAKQCPDLQELVLIGVHVTHFSMAAIASNCRRLERLALCGSGAIGDAEIACIAAKCVELKKLCIKGCAISDFAIEALAWGCPNLVKVKVRKCRGVSSEAVDWLLRRKGSLVVSFDAIESEGLDASGSDVVGQESGVEFPVMGGQVVVGDGPSVSNGRLAQFRAKMGLFASRNLVPRAFHRPSNHGDSSKSNL